MLLFFAGRKIQIQPVEFLVVRANPEVEINCA
jgi:hypothetical protein